MLKTSGISKEDVAANPQGVLDVLQFHMQGPPPKLPNAGALKTAESAALNIIKDNPNKFYKKVRKLGEGFVDQIIWPTNSLCLLYLSPLSTL